MNSVKFLILGLILGYHLANASTSAGTQISNQAFLEFKQGNSGVIHLSSNISTFNVDELLDLQLNWIDSSKVSVNSPDVARVLTFTLINTGNNSQTFNLDSKNNLGGDNFDPVLRSSTIYIENNLQPGFQLTGNNADSIYKQGTTITLLPGQVQNIYLVYDIPANQALGSTANAQLTATLAAPFYKQGDPAGTVYSGKASANAILGASKGIAQSIGTYLVSGIQTQINKTVSKVVDSKGGAMITSGSIVTYHIDLKITGQGTAKGLFLKDPLPSEVTYVANTLKLNGQYLTDTQDQDMGDVTNGIISINLGDVLTPGNYTIEYQVKIN